ncbi:uncharacterized protein BO95DRAFT_114167 [Aspergillus brunneoviolaceus CBS 621.78]|uniref:Uncharacterized protein n=1 Tax=Aspergillus brunneoviolaceus CBS 621.78 TaxID=1450534 RepID=A0ACD1GNI8_9EURO|nr:hypothetical protein BO95DRAFT_114167 [Aspergillus brunneoviolaceus CBS 621.78]RAH50802.1 hypothetical protein BO95DRAFT_114167 [Aspergillus brunneoviolaceus CBS 621.78]
MMMILGRSKDRSVYAWQYLAQKQEGKTLWGGGLRSKIRPFRLRIPNEMHMNLKHCHYTLHVLYLILSLSSNP